ncbi:hypothetical protein JW979_06525 [bacterium]|nr:hypothetical protein [candidate division CSSED10-310 bacterium]
MIRKTIILMITGLFITVLAQTQAIPGSQKKLDQEMVKKCDQLLGKLVGDWKGTLSKDGKPLSVTLSFERTVQDQFIKGYITEKDAEGKVVYEALIMLQHNPGLHKYFMYAFENTGWFRQFIGQEDPDMMLVQGIVALEGVEHYQWEFVDDSKLQRSHWGPVSEGSMMDGPPNEVIIFEKVSAAK